MSVRNKRFTINTIINYGLLAGERLNRARGFREADEAFFQRGKEVQELLYRINELCIPNAETFGYESRRPKIDLLNPVWENDDV